MIYAPTEETLEDFSGSLTELFQVIKTRGFCHIRGKSLSFNKGLPEKLSIFFHLNPNCLNNRWARETGPPMKHHVYPLRKNTSINSTYFSPDAWSPSVATKDWIIALFWFLFYKRLPTSAVIGNNHNQLNFSYTYMFLTVFVKMFQHFQHIHARSI